MINNFDITIEEALTFMFGETGNPAKVSYERVDAKQKTRAMDFFWKATSGNYGNFLREDQINQFYKKYSDEMKLIGYS